MLSDKEKKITLSFLKSFAKTFIFKKKVSLAKIMLALQRQKYYRRGGSR